MAKQAKQEKVIQSVELKDPKQVIYLKSRGFKLTAENLTIARYQQLIALSKTFEQYFNVKLTNKQNDQPEVQA